MRFVLVLAGLALLAFTALFILQRRLIYPAPTAGEPVTATGFAPVDLVTADGLRLTALYRQAAAGRPTIVFFHGNGDSLRGSVVATAALASTGYGVLLPEYRGYGGNPGHPDEAGLYADGRAALAFLAKRGIAPSAMVVIGYSLGSGVAVQLATEIPLAGLVVVAGFTSLGDAAAGAFRLPLAALVHDRFDNLGKIGQIDTPVLVLHGDFDRSIAVTHGRALAATNPRATYREFPGAGHDLAFRPDVHAAITLWIGALGPPRVSRATAIERDSAALCPPHAGYTLGDLAGYSGFRYNPLNPVADGWS